MRYDDNRTGTEKLAEGVAKGVVLGGFASLAILALVGAVALVKLVF